MSDIAGKSFWHQDSEAETDGLRTSAGTQPRLSLGPAESVLSGRRILVVEDEMMVSMAIALMLADLGCESVTIADTVEEALVQIGLQRFDAAMLDVNLNGVRCYRVADALASQSVPFLFSTGYSEPDSPNVYGDTPVLSKPFQHADLAELLGRLLAGEPAG